MLNISAYSIVSKYLKSKYLGRFDISEKELNDILREVRIAFLNADVNLEVIKSFFSEIREELLIKKNYSRSTSTDVVVFSTIKSKLIDVLGTEHKELNVSKSRINKILMIGLNGAGKTTTTAKLSYYAKNDLNMNVKNVSLDVYRPGAYEQLKQLSDPHSIPCERIAYKKFREGIKSQIASAEKDGVNCIFFDSYGLLPDNSELLNEVAEIKKILNPNEVLFVVDSMSGQEILDCARLFHDKLGITGIVASKTDSNAPMGGVFSVSYLLKIPIKYMGTGEDVSKLTPFYPDRIASLILGEGDILSLSEQIEKNVDTDVSKKFISRFMSGQFDLNDLIIQIKEIKKMGSLKGFLKMLPNQFKVNSLPLDNAESQLKVWEVLIGSMTIKERKNPKLLKKQPGRRIRIVKGSGRKADELNKLLKRWEESKKKIDSLSSSLRSGKNAFPFLSN